MKLRTLVAAALMVPACAMADGEFTLTPFGTYHWYANKLHDKYPTEGVSDHGGGGLAIGYRFTPSMEVELDGNRTSTKLKTTGNKVTNDLYSLDGLYRFRAGSSFEPYVLVGAGEYQLKPKDLEKESDTMVEAGIGAFYHLNDYFALRGEWRAVYDYDHHYTDGLALLGLQLSTGNFGGNKPLPVAPQPAPEPAPAPAPAPTAYVAPPPPAPAPVMDSDGDGVPDERDKCPNTPHGALVDFDGCPQMLKEAISKELHILFDTNKAVIKPEYKDEVSEIAKLATQYPSAVIEIQGHTDSTGGKKLNDKLSQERAGAVRESLIKDFGIAADRITAKGYGSSMPVADNKTAEGKAKNRRVIAVISGERERMKMKKKK